eukprot:1073032-Prymnesium_polylepis.1
MPRTKLRSSPPTSIVVAAAAKMSMPPTATRGGPKRWMSRPVRKPGANMHAKCTSSAMVVVLAGQQWPIGCDWSQPLCITIVSGDMSITIE